MNRTVFRSILTAAFVIVAILAPPGLNRKAGAQTAEKIPVILDTDIGDDIDDTWALALLLRSPELDLKLVTTDYGNTTYRAKIVAKLLETAGRTDIPIGIGIRQNDSLGKQAPWVKDYNLARYPGRVYQDGVHALIDTIMKSERPVTLICIGPLPNIKAALEREPAISSHARFVGMDGSIRRGYDGSLKPDAEWNVKADVGASRAALSAPWGITITPLDTCGIVKLTGRNYAAVRSSKDVLARAVVEAYRIWSGGDKKAETESSTLFDTVAVYLASSERLVDMERLSIRVTDEGRTVIDPDGKVMNCATAWKNLQAFEELLVSRLTGP